MLLFTYKFTRIYDNPINNILFHKYNTLLPLNPCVHFKTSQYYSVDKQSLCLSKVNRFNCHMNMSEWITSDAVLCPTTNIHLTFIQISTLNFTNQTYRIVYYVIQFVSVLVFSLPFVYLLCHFLLNKYVVHELWPWLWLDCTEQLSALLIFIMWYHWKPL